MTEVRLIGGAVAIVGGSKDNNIITTAERIFVEGDWTKVNIRVMARCLVGGGTVKVPVGELAQVSDLVSDCLKGNYGVQKGGRQRGRRSAYLALATKLIVATDPNI